MNLGIFKINEYDEPEGLYKLTPQKTISKNIWKEISTDVVVIMEQKLNLALDEYFIKLKGLKANHTNKEIIIEELQEAFEHRQIKAMSNTQYLNSVTPVSVSELSPKSPHAWTTKTKPVIPSSVEPKFSAFLKKVKKIIAKNVKNEFKKFNKEEPKLAKKEKEQKPQYELIETILNIIKESVPLPKPRGSLPYHVDTFHYAAHLLIAADIVKSSSHLQVFNKIKKYYIRKK